MPLLPARKAKKGTSYTSKGVADDTIQQPQLDNELGSSQPAIIREIVPDLISPYQRTLTYAKMMNDAGVDVSVRAWKTPILGAEFYIDPYDALPENVDIADFVWENLSGGMSAPFINSIEDILHFCEDGYAILEKSYELREYTPRGQGRNTKQYTMLKKLGVRPPSTIKKIEYDNNGGPTQITQGAIQADGKPVDKTLDIANILIFTLNRRGGDLTGKSMLRTAYPHWYYKTHFYKIDAIQKERHALGVPKGKLLPGFKPKDKEILRQLLKNLRTNEESFMVLTPNVDVEFAEMHGQPVDVLSSASHHNIMILMNVMAQFFALGVEGGSGGGRATGGVQSDIFMKALKYIANYIADVINMYLIPELVVWNFPTKSFPKLKVRNIGETRDLQMLGSALGNVLAQEGIQPDDRFENWLRQLFDAPLKDPTTTRAKSAPVQGLDTAAASPGNSANGNTNGNAGAGDGNPGGKGKARPGSGNNGKPTTAPQ